MTKTWTKEEALPVLREAYLAKRLSAQNGGRRCAYRSPQGPCIIGVLLDDETASRWDRKDNSLGLYNRVGSYAAEMRAMFGDDLDWFRTVQNHHDDWLYGRPKAVDALEGLLGIRQPYDQP